MEVLYKGQKLRLIRFWGNHKACLWITNPSQIDIPGMEFVGGYPDEYCIFLEKLNSDDLACITSLDGNNIDLEEFLDVDYYSSRT